MSFYDSTWDKPYLTPSIAVELLTRSPYHARLKCPYYGEGKDKSTQAMIEGRVVDCLVLGGKPGVKVQTLGAYSTKAARKARDDAAAAGVQTIKLKDYERCVDAAISVRDSIDKLGPTVTEAIKHGVIKKRLFWEVDGVYCSTEPDVHIPHLNSVLDLKRTRCIPTREGWQRQCDSMDYHVQAAAVLEATGATTFGWLIVEAAFPHAAVVHWASDVFLERGERDWQMAKDTWRECVELDEFTGYESGVIDPMPWRVAAKDDDKVASVRFSE